MKHRKLWVGVGFVVAVGVVCLCLKRDIRFWGLMFTLRPSAKRLIAHYCKTADDCVQELRSSIDGCGREAIGDSDSLFVGADAKKLNFCLQKRFAAHKCQSDAKCLAVLDGLYDKCFGIVFDNPANLRSPASSDLVASCLRTKSYLVE